jgi:hypothetical protein
VIAPNIAKPTTKPITDAMANTRWLNSRSGSTGSRARRSAATKPTVLTTNAAISPSAWGEVQAHTDPAKLVTSTIQVAAAPSSVMPATSMLGRPTTVVRGRTAASTTSATRPTGTLT